MQSKFGVFPFNWDYAISQAAAAAGTPHSSKPALGSRVSAATPETLVVRPVSG